MSINWVGETPDHFVWALQFGESRGCLGLFLPQRTVSASELATREAVFAAAQRVPEVTNVRWISAAEFQRSY